MHTGHEVSLAVHDNRRGFDTAAPRKPQSLGLAGVRERGQMLKGTVSISAPGSGTRVEARIPVPRTGDAA